VTAAAPVTPPSSSSSFSFHRPCWAEIDTAALRSNWRALRQKLAPNVQMLAVVKADGYGLGLLTVAQVAVDEGAAYLGVSSVEEGIRLREAGVQTPILILGSLFPFESFSLLFKHRLTPTIASLEAADALDQMAGERKEKCPIHLKIDSGFGRIGVSAANAPALIQQVSQKENLVIEGLYTHFASSDLDADYTLAQAKAFFAALEKVQAQGIRPRWIHLANSSALLKFPETHGTLVRPGLAYYGVPPYAGASSAVSLKTVVTWKSRVIFIKTVPAGTSVSYARTWTAKRPTRVATLAAGYADGLPRIVSNKGQVLLGGRRVPILGRVTMDMTMVDATELPDCHVGDEAVLLGRQGQEEITAQELAEWAETNAYEILCGIGARVPRITTHGG
jgi:alanine racemase